MQRSMGMHAAPSYKTMCGFVDRNAIEQLRENLTLRGCKLLLGDFEQAQSAACFRNEAVTVVTGRHALVMLISRCDLPGWLGKP